MVYDHAVIAYGKYYTAGAEVPEEKQVVDIPAESIQPETEEEKSKRTRKTTQEKTE